MKILSLFDGISCARVALGKMGIPVEVYYASEIDKYAEQISQRNFPDNIRVGDVTTICERFDLNPKFGNGIDLLIGGSPCQDLSIAKKDRKGLSGDRSGLFWEYVRILNEVKPKYFILENVASMPKEAKQLITETLGVEPIMIDAALVSAQRRKRLFWTNIPKVEQPKDREIYLKDILQPEIEVDEKYYIKDATLHTILEKMRQGKPLAQAFRIQQTDGKAVTLSALGGGAGAKTGLYLMAPNGSEQKKSLTLTASYPKKNLQNYLLKSDGQMVVSIIDVYNKKIKEDGKAKTLGTNPQCMSAIAGQAIVIMGKARGKNKGYESQEKSPTLTGSSWQYNNFLQLYKEGKLIVRRLTPIECERLQSLPDGHTEGVSDSQRYKACGNAFNADVIAHILSFIPKN